MDNVEKSLNGSKGTGDKMCMEARQKRRRTGKKRRKREGKRRERVKKARKGKACSVEKSVDNRSGRRWITPAEKVQTFLT